jgi:hypothetical protein
MGLAFFDEDAAAAAGAPLASDFDLNVLTGAGNQGGGAVGALKTPPRNG